MLKKCNLHEANDICFQKCTGIHSISSRDFINGACRKKHKLSYHYNGASGWVIRERLIIINFHSVNRQDSFHPAHVDAQLSIHEIGKHLQPRHGIMIIAWGTERKSKLNRPTSDNFILIPSISLSACSFILAVLAPTTSFVERENRGKSITTF